MSRQCRRDIGSQLLAGYHRNIAFFKSKIGRRWYVTYSTSFRNWTWDIMREVFTYPLVRNQWRDVGTVSQNRSCFNFENKISTRRHHSPLVQHRKVYFGSTVSIIHQFEIEIEISARHHQFAVVPTSSIKLRHVITYQLLVRNRNWDACPMSPDLYLEWNSWRTSSIKHSTNQIRTASIN